MIEPALSGPTEYDDMQVTLDIDLAALMREIARYLAAVDAFRAESCEPTWRPEPLALTRAGTQARRARGGARPARA
jgi:hypothetical protein